MGYLAKAQQVSNPYGTIYGVKRLVGQRYTDMEVQSAKRTLPYAILEGDKPGQIHIQLEDRRLTPEQVSAEILKAVKAQAETVLGEPADAAVITVPAHFNDGQRKSTKRAAELAGLDVIRLINEPTAAALSYGYGRRLKTKIAVYDFGGGTFDVTILDIGEKIYEVISTNGDTYLGGDDFSDRIVQRISNSFHREKGVDLTKDKASLQRVRDAAERAKVELSRVPQTKINLPQIAPWADPDLNLIMELGQDELEEAVGDLVDQSLEICQVALDLSRLTVGDIEDVIMVGGQTRMPLIQRKVEEFFGRRPNLSVNPDEVVALGAAIQANTLVSDKEDILLLDVTPMTLGIQTFGDIFSVLIEKNTKIPRKLSRVFTTNTDYQERVRIVVLQGEQKKASQNVLLGEFSLEGIRLARRMEPKIEVTFKVDANGILNVSARDLDTNQQQSITIRDYISRSE